MFCQACGNQGAVRRGMLWVDCPICQPERDILTGKYEGLTQEEDDELRELAGTPRAMREPDEEDRFRELYGKLQAYESGF